MPEHAVAADVVGRFQASGDHQPIGGLRSRELVDAGGGPTTVGSPCGIRATVQAFSAGRNPDSSKV